jgi:hypothetical protein
VDIAPRIVSQDAGRAHLSLSRGVLPARAERRARRHSDASASESSPGPPPHRRRPSSPPATPPNLRQLLARVFALDVTRFRLRVLEVVSDPEAIARILHGARAVRSP